MSKFERLDPKSQKIHRNWTRIKHAKAQVNGETEITLHNRILRSEAKARQF
ncbi:YpzG family protein [Lysinibacillus piscis]|uniref:YpzG family protein n=1 Tax=Lysinibacillus piscis TaxID=2518931 RepID=A0ABQ5NM72_9BACI|nr:YpzG family protein [Lysinibacillus sp. KH24]GLC89223.1 YpzG family protein [Lysinibacillus sp. KH24]